MNNENEIKPGDLLAINEAGNIVKATNESKPIGEAFAVYEDIGMLIRYASGIVNIEIPNPLCSYCKVAQSNHWKTEAGGHPFFKDNLEYLEWESARG